MTSAIYARKSTDQSGISDEQKSIARQVEHARSYAARKGWAVDDAHIFVDDGVSGAEFANRAGFVRLMNALKPRPPFQVLIMSEESRLGREAIETAYALKQLITAGVRVFFYLEDRERTLESPTDKLLMSVTAFADELEREKARQRTYDALVRKARAGHVTGGRVFGYRNRDVIDATGQRSHVERDIVAAEAAVIRTIFERCAAGEGIRSIAKALNAVRAIGPRPQQGRQRSWAPSTVREVLYREAYRGVIVWNQSRKRDRWGQKAQRPRPDVEWIRVDAPTLRIVSDDVWDAAHARLGAARERYLRGTDGRLWGKPQMGTEARYLLSGLMECWQCGGSLIVATRAHGRARKHFYVCANMRERGTCSNRAWLPLWAVDEAILSGFEDRLLAPARLEAAVELARAQIAIRTVDTKATVADIDARLAALAGEIDRLTAALAQGATLQSVVAALRARETEQAQLQDRRRQLGRAAERSALDSELRTLESDVGRWRQLLRGHIPQARQILRKLLRTRIVLRPEERDGIEGVSYSAVASLVGLLEGFLSSAVLVTSPAGFEPALPA